MFSAISIVYEVSNAVIYWHFTWIKEMRKIVMPDTKIWRVFVIQIWRAFVIQIRTAFVIQIRGPL